MLAENMNIDVRTKWRDAQDILREDPRYKNVEDPREREDLFRDFISELEKKEKEDLVKTKDKAINLVKDILKSLAGQSSPLSAISLVPQHLKPSALLTLKSSWGEFKNMFMELIQQKVEFKALNENDCRRCFLDYQTELEELQKAEGRKKKDTFFQSLAQYKADITNFIDDLAEKGQLHAFTRWKEFILVPLVQRSSAYQNLWQLVSTSEHQAYLLPQVKIASESDFQQEILRDIFDARMVSLQEQYKDDRHLVKKLVHDNSAVEIVPSSSYSEWKSRLLRECRLIEKKNELAHEGDQNMEDLPVHPYCYELDPNPSAVSTTSAICRAEPMRDAQTEEGEEVEEPDKAVDLPISAPAIAPVAQPVTSALKSGLLGQVQSLILKRPWNLKDIFLDLHEKILADYEEDKRHQRKLEEKYISLLKENFYLSDHVGIKWDDAKQTLKRRSAYEALGHSERKRLFHEYMDELAEKLKQKSLAMKAYETLEPGEYPPASVLSKPATTTAKKRERDRSNSSTDFEKLVRQKR